MQHLLVFFITLVWLLPLSCFSTRKIGQMKKVYSKVLNYDHIYAKAVNVICNRSGNIFDAYSFVIDNDAKKAVPSFFGNPNNTDAQNQAALNTNLLSFLNQVKLFNLDPSDVHTSSFNATTSTTTIYYSASYNFFPQDPLAGFNVIVTAEHQGCDSSNSTHICTIKICTQSNVDDIPPGIASLVVPKCKVDMDKCTNIKFTGTN